MNLARLFPGVCLSQSNNLDNKQAFRVLLEFIVINTPDAIRQGIERACTVVLEASLLVNVFARGKHDRSLFLVLRL